MRTRLKKHRLIILAVFLITVVTIAGWAFAFHYDNKAKSAGPQNELQNDIQVATVMQLALDHSKIILLLVCAGLIGFFGVRRQGNTLNKFAINKRSEIRLRINLLPENNQKRQASHQCKRDVPRAKSAGIRRS